MERNIPEELMEEILSKLPAKSLLRFMSVHRSWYALIKNPNFVYRQHKKPLSSNNTLLLRLNPRHFSFCTDDRDFKETRRVSISPCSVLMGTCNGLVCIFHRREKTLVLWNPSIRKLIRLPQPKSATPGSFFGDNIGFGFDSSTSDFKVVYLNAKRTWVFAEVYSVKEGFWRDIETTEPIRNVTFTCHGPQVFANNELYWLLSRRFDSMNSFVLVFDLRREVFRRITLPDSCFRYHLSLHCLGSSIALIVNKSDLFGYEFFHVSQDIDVFVMKDLGTVNSWERTSVKITGWRVLGFKDKRSLLMIRRDRKQSRYLSYGDDIKDFGLKITDCSVIGTYEEDNLALLDNENVEGDGWDDFHVYDRRKLYLMDSWRGLTMIRARKLRKLEILIRFL